MEKTVENAGLDAILAERERRARRQKALLAAHRRTLVCLTLNIPGPVKTGPAIDRCFAAGVAEIEKTARTKGFATLHFEARDGPAGRSAFFVLDADALPVKEAMCAIEETHPVGRLFDIDVLAPAGEKISRQQVGAAQRKCFICGAAAAVCARSRAHGLAAVVQAANSLLDGWARAES